jgi:hypothetical protein
LHGQSDRSRGIAFVIDERAAALPAQKTELHEQKLPRRSFPFARQIEVEIVVARFDFGVQLGLGGIPCRNRWRVSDEFMGDFNTHGVRTNNGAQLAAFVGQLVATVCVGPARRSPLRSFWLKHDVRLGKWLAIERHTPVYGRDLRPPLATTGERGEQYNEKY